MEISHILFNFNMKKEVLDAENPVYKDLKDVPEYWKPTAAALLEAGAVNGGTSAEVCATDLNLRKDL